MSETTTIFQPGQMAVAPEPPELDEPSSNNRALLILGALAGVAVLAIAAYFLLFAGGDDTVADTAAPNAVIQPSTAPSTAPSTSALPKISARNFGTDPFKALLADDTAAPGTTGTTAGTTTGATAGTATGTTTGTTAGTTTGSSTTGTTIPVDPTPTASEGYRFRVMKVGDLNSTVNVRVDGKLYKNLKAGQVFAKVFKVRAIGGATNAFQIGDLKFTIAGTKSVTISG